MSVMKRSFQIDDKIIECRYIRTNVDGQEVEYFRIGDILEALCYKHFEKKYEVPRLRLLCKDVIKNLTKEKDVTQLPLPRSITMEIVDHRAADCQETCTH